MAEERDERQVPLAGLVDERVLVEIDEQLKDEHHDFSDYLTLREIAHLTHVTVGRARHAVTYAKLRPMSGIKRGPLWFVSRMEALRWAKQIADFEWGKWEKNARRLGRMIKREERRLDPNPVFVYAPHHHNYDPPPPGVRVYTYQEAAAAVGTTMNTIYFLTSRGKPLGDVQRWLLPDRTKVIAADPVDAYAARERNPNRVAHGMKSRKSEAPALAIVSTTALRETATDGSRQSGGGKERAS